MRFLGHDLAGHHVVELGAGAYHGLDLGAGAHELVHELLRVLRDVHQLFQPLI